MGSRLRENDGWRADADMALVQPAVQFAPRWLITAFP